MYHCRCTLETSVTFKPPFIASSVELVGNAGIYENTESTRQAKTTAHNPSECIHSRRRKTCRSEWGKPRTAFPRGKHTLMFRVSLDAKHVSSAFICCLLSFYESQATDYVYANNPLDSHRPLHFSILQQLSNRRVAIEPILTIIYKPSSKVCLLNHAAQSLPFVWRQLILKIERFLGNLGKLSAQ